MNRVVVFGIVALLVTSMLISGVAAQETGFSKFFSNLWAEIRPLITGQSISELSLIDDSQTAPAKTSSSPQITDLPVISDEPILGILADVTAPQISIVSPTPANGGGIIGSAEMNMTIDEPNLDLLIFNWDEINYSIYGPSLLLAMNFNNNSAIGENGTYSVDSSMYSNNLTLKNGTTYTSSGKFGSGMQLDGIDDFATVASNSSITGSATYSFWFKYDRAMSGLRILVGSGVCLGEWENVIGFNLGGVTTSHRIGMLLLAPGVGWGTAATQSTTNVTGGAWHHVTFTKSGTTAKTYIDGLLEDTQSSYGSTATSNRPIVFGAYTQDCGASYDPTYSVNSSIDEFRAYNRELSADEISKIYYSELAKYNLTQWNFYNNVTNVSITTHTMFTWANDTSGNVGETTLRTFNTQSMNETVISYGPRTLYLNDTTYTLNQSITCSGTCLTINATNVTIDCQGNSITSGGSAINITSNNATITGCRIASNVSSGTSYLFPVEANNTLFVNNTVVFSSSSTFSYGFCPINTYNLRIINNTITSTTRPRSILSTDAFVCLGSNNLVWDNNNLTISTGFTGTPFLFGSGPNLNANITNSIFEINGSSTTGLVYTSGDNRGLYIFNNSVRLNASIYFLYDDYATLTGLKIIQNNVSIFDGVRSLYIGPTNEVLGSIISNNSFSCAASTDCLAFESMSGLNLTNNYISCGNSVTDAVYLLSTAYGGVVSRNIFNCPKRNIRIESSSSTNKTLLLDQEIGNYSFKNAGAIIEKSGFGRINFLNTTLLAEGNNLSLDVRITNSTLFVNSTNSPGFNVSANITMYGLNVASPQIMVALDDLTFTECSAPECNVLSNVGGNAAFNVSHFTTYLVQDTPVSANLSCEDPLNETNTVYYLNNSVNSSGTCFTINATNVTLDCQGFSINYSQTTSGVGVNITDANSTAVRNCQISGPNGNGIYMYLSFNSSVRNSNIIANGASARGIDLDTAIYTDIVNNTIYGQQRGLYFHYNSFLRGSQYNNIINNSISGGVGAYIDGDSHYNTFYNNIITGSNSGASNGAVYVGSAAGETLTSNSLISTGSSGYGVFSSGDNHLLNLTSNTINITQSGGYAISINGATGASYFVANNTLISAGGDFETSVAGGTVRVNLLDQVLGAYSISADTKMRIAQTNFGELSFLAGTSGTVSGSNFSNSVKIMNSSVQVNSTANAGLNLSANITMHGLNLISPQIKVAYDDSTFSACPPPGCNNLSYNSTSGTFTFNVSHFTTYQIQETLSGTSTEINISACGNLDQENVTYLLNQSITSAGTCFDVLANNVTLDCQGFNLTGAYSGSGISSGVNYTSIKNCVILSYSNGVYISSGQKSIVSNNTLGLNGYGLFLQFTFNNTILNNILESNTNGGVYIDSSSNNNISNNTASSGISGIQLTLSNDNVFELNNVSSNNNYGFYLSDSSNNSLAYNDASLNGDYGVYIVSGSNNLLVGNRADYSTAAILKNAGIYLKASSWNTLLNNTARSNYYGVYLNQSLNNNLSENILSGNTNVGLYLRESSSNALINNTALSNYNGIELELYSQNNTLSGNNASYSGNMGIFITSFSSNNTLSSNKAGLNDIGVYIYSQYNTLTGNEIYGNNKNLNVLFAEETQNISASNTVDGKTVYWLSSVSDQIFDSSSNVGIFACFWCNNITLIDSVLTNSTIGASFKWTNNSRIENITARSDYTGISLISSDNNIFSGNNLSSNGIGLSLDTSSNNTILNSEASLGNYGVYIYSGSGNNVSGSTANSNTNSGIYFDTTSENAVSNSTFSSNGWGGLTLSSSNNNILINNLLEANTIGIDLSASIGNNVSNNTVLSNTDTGILVESNSDGNFFLDNNLTSSTNIEFYISSGLNNILVNNTLGGTNSYLVVDAGSAGNNMTGTAFSSTDGQILFPQTILIPEGSNVNIAGLNISFNNTYLNSASLQFLNASAKMTLTGLGFVNPQIMMAIDDINFVQCIEPECVGIYYNQTEGIGIFNVSHFTTYLLQEETVAETNVTSCQDLNETNRVYYLNNSISSLGTCLNVTANNVTLDCLGLNLTGDSTGDGVISNGYNYTTIKNCRIFNFSSGIYLANGARDGLIINNTLTSNSGIGIFLGQNTAYNLLISNRASSSIYGIDLEGSSFNNLTNNTATTNSLVGILLSSMGGGAINSSNNILNSNNVSGNTAGDGIQLSYGNNNLIINNTLRSNTRGMRMISGSNGNTLLNNNITGNSNQGIGLNTASNNVISQNFIAAPNAANAGGINMAPNSTNNTISGNRILTNGTSGIAIQLSTGTNNNILTGNNIITYMASAHGIVITNSSLNIASWNNLTLYGPNMRGIGVVDGHSNNASYNNITTYGNNTAGLRLANTASNNTLLGNTITMNGDASAAFRIFETSNNNNFTENYATINNGTSGGIQVGNSGVSHNHTFIGNYIHINTSAGYASKFAVGARDNLLLNNVFFMADAGNFIVTDGTASANNMANATLAASAGSVNYPQTIAIPSNADANVLTNRLNLSQNYVYLNSSYSNVSFLNTSAIITLNNLNFTEPQIKVAYDDSTFQTCTAPECNNLSYNGSTLIFNVSHFTTYFIQETPVSANLTCGNLNVTNQVYYLNNSVNSSGTCFTISANNVTLDCQGYSITGNITGDGINNTGGFDFITIQNCHISNFNEGINFGNVANSTVTNNTVGFNGDAGIQVSFSSGNNFSGNTVINNSQNGFHVGSSGNNIIQNNNVSINGNIGIYLFSSSNNNLTQNIVRSNNAGIRFDSSSNSNILIENNVSFNILSGIQFDTGQGNTATSNRLEHNGQYGLYIYSSTSNNVANNTFYNNSNGIRAELESNFNVLDSNNVSDNVEGIYFGFGPSGNNITNNFVSDNGRSIGLFTSCENNTIVNNDLINAETNIDSSLGNVFINNRMKITAGSSDYINIQAVGFPVNFTNNTFITGNGSVNYPQTLTSGGFNGTISTNDLAITFNRTFLNSTRVGFLNSSADLTMHGLNFTNPRIMVATDDSTFNVCTDCNNLSWNGSTMIFNVSHFTTYVIQETTVAEANLTCGNLNNASTVYYLNNSVNSSGTCFTISANNVTLDCQGFLINHSQATSGIGIDIGGNLATVRNCNIVLGNTSIIDSYGIYLSSTMNNTLQGNNITSSGSSARGIILMNNVNNTLISGNNVTALSGSEGIHLQGYSSWNILSNNSFSAQSNAVVLELGQYNNLTGNAISASGSGPAILLFSGANNDLLSGNRISSTCASAGGGISLSGTNSESIIGNNISTVNCTLISDSSSNYTIISGNNLLASGTSTSLVGFSMTSTIETQIIGNNFSIPSTASSAMQATGILNGIISGNNASNLITISTSTNASLDGNRIIMNKSSGGSAAIAIFGANNTVSNNYIINSGAGANVVRGINLNPSGFVSTNNLVENNTIILDGFPTTTGSQGPVAINVRFAGASNITINNNDLTVVGQYGFGIQMQNSSIGFTVSNNIFNISGSSGTGISMAVGSSNNSFTSNEITAGGYYVVSDSSSIGNNMTNTTFRTSNGKINFPQNIGITANANVSTTQLSLTSNSIYLNSSNPAASLLNTSATITFNGLPGMTNPRIVTSTFANTNWARCTSAMGCNNISYNSTSGFFVFNVTHFSTYQIQDAPTSAINISSCNGLGVVDAVYYLNQSLNASAGCFGMNADNVTFDCQGNTLNYSQSSQGTGITVNGGDSKTIKNCNIFQGSSTDFSYGVFITENMNNLLLLNNSIATAGTNSRVITSFSPSWIANSSLINNTLRSFSNATGNAYGLQITGSGKNITVMGNNFTVSNFSFNALSLANTHNSLIQANYFNHQVALTNSSNNSIINNIINSSAAGISLAPSSNRVLVTGNIISGNSIIAKTQGISLNNGQNNTIMSGNVFSGNNIYVYGTTDPGIRLFAGGGVSRNNTIVSNNITDNVILTAGTNKHGIYFQANIGGNNTVLNNLLSGNNITVNAHNSSAIQILSNIAIGNNATGNVFINNILYSIGSYIFNNDSTGNTITNTTFLADNGSAFYPAGILIPNGVNVSTINLNISYNRTYLNSTDGNISFLNTSAVLTMFGLNFTNPQIMIALDDSTFSVCADCTNLSYNQTSGIFVFNVSHFTTYSAQETPVSTNLSCGDPIDQENMTYYLNNSVNSSIRCFNVLANNVTLDCQGFNITGYNAGVPGIEINEHNGTTVRNCIISNFSYGISLGVGANNATIFNNTITYASIRGISVASSSFASISNNRVSLGLFGIVLESSLGDTVTSNRLTANTGQGILVQAGSNNSVVNYNNITTSATGIWLQSGSNNNSFTENIVNTNGTSNSVAFSVNAVSNNNTFTANIANTTGTGNFNHGFSISASSYNQFISNNITTLGTSSHGFALGANSNWNTILSNDIDVYGQTVLDIRIDSSANNNVSFNNVTTHGNNSAALRVANTASNNTFFRNIVVLNGDLNSGLRTGETANHNSYIENRVTINNESSFGEISAGIRIGNSVVSHNNTFTGNYIYVNSSTGRATMITNGASDNLLVNNTFFMGAAGTFIVTDGTSANNNMTNTTFATNNGEVEYNQTIAIPSSAYVNLASLNISHNQTYLNSSNSNISFLNTSAILTMFGLNFTNPQIMVALDDSTFNLCSDCTNLSYNQSSGTFVFNVSHFTTYSAQETPTNVAPQITAISLNGTVTPYGGGVRVVEVNFTVYDADGFADLNVSTARVNFTRTGSALRANESCFNVSSAGNEVNFTCTVDMWYFDAPGTWNVTASISDSFGASAQNFSNFTYAPLLSFASFPEQVEWLGLQWGETNKLASTPTYVNNTGNLEIANVSFTAIDLLGENNSNYVFPSSNFTVSNESGIASCSGSRLINNTEIGVISLIAPGNLSAGQAQSAMHYCIPLVPSSLIRQRYTTFGGGSWMINVV